MFNLIDNIKNKINNNDGFYNCHSHLDRAFTLTEDNFYLSQADLREKWRLVDSIKHNSSEKDIFKRMSFVLSKQIFQGVRGIISFIDFDEIIEDRAYKAVEACKERYNQINIKYANQTLKGVLNREARYWFDFGSERCDIIGSLPAKDGDKYLEHLDIVFKRAKELDKPVHVHVDQFNTWNEKETDIVLDKVKEWNLEGKVTLIHCISLACHPKDYREDMYRKIKETDTKIICCPSAWMDSPRKEEFQPSHNSITPVDEMLNHDIIVGIGTDNISDLMCPFIDGNILTELKNLAIMCRIYDENKLLKIVENSKIICDF